MLGGRGGWRGLSVGGGRNVGTRPCRWHPGQNPGAGGSRSGGLTSAADEVSEARNGGASWDADPVAEVVPEGDAELLAGFGEAEEASRQSRPRSLWVPPLTWRLVTWQRMSLTV